MKESCKSVMMKSSAWKDSSKSSRHHTRLYPNKKENWNYKRVQLSQNC